MRRREDEGSEDPIERPPVGQRPPPPPPPAPAPPPPPQPVLTVAQGARMSGDQYVPAGGELRSASGRYTLVYQGDGNLVLYKNYPYHDRKWLWDTATFSPPGRCIMQGDGNLVLYGPSGNYIWDSSTHGNPGAYVTVQDDGDVVVRRASGEALWATRTAQPAPPPSGPSHSGSTIQGGQALNPGGFINTASGTFSLVFQADGNLVLYRNYKTGGRRALWASGTNGKRAQVCIMQSDGRLAIYSPDGDRIWSVGSEGHWGARLVLHEHGDLVLYGAGGEVLWSTDTPRVEFSHNLGGSDGWVSLTIRPNGSVRFQGHARNGDMFAESVDFRIGVVVKFDPYRALALYETGHLGTKTTPGGSPIDRKWDRTETGNKLVELHYEAIERDGQLSVMHERKGQLSQRLEDVLDAGIRWIVGSALVSMPFGQLILIGAVALSRLGEGTLLPGARFIEGALWLAGPAGTLYALAGHGLSKLDDDQMRRLRDFEYKFAQDLFKGTLPAIDQMWMTNHTGLGNREFVFPSLDGILINMGPKAHAAQKLEDHDLVTFVHELTHAWQIKNTDMTAEWLADAMYSQVCNTLGDDAYAFDPDRLKPFGDYNLEQQASLVATWFAQTSGLPAHEQSNHPLHRYMVEHIWMGRP